MCSANNLCLAEVAVAVSGLTEQMGRECVEGEGIRPVQPQAGGQWTLRAAQPQSPLEDGVPLVGLSEGPSGGCSTLAGLPLEFPGSCSPVVLGSLLGEQLSAPGTWPETQSSL